MSVTKMLAVTMAGPLDRFDHIVSKYIYKSDIHLENALSVLGEKQKKLKAFDTVGSYDPVIKKAGELLSAASIKLGDNTEESKMSLGEMEAFLEKAESSFSETVKKCGEIDEKIAKNKGYIENMEPLMPLATDLSALSDFEFIAYRFGKLPKGGYKTLNTYLSDMNVVFVKTKEDEHSVWGLYFVPVDEKKKADEIFTSLYFERIRLPEKLSGTPEAMVKALKEENAALAEERKKISESASSGLDEYKEELIKLYETAKKRRAYADVRNMAAHSDDYFYIVGWMGKKDAKALGAEVKNDYDVALFYTENPENLKGIVSPPTKLRNNPVFKPFEMFVKMYGYPEYNEVDPTPILAVTYILFFGMMFGDLGQSLVIALLGLYVGYKKNNDLAKILGIVGFSGAVFGVLYGSVFGLENIIHGVLPPMENITTLLIGTISMGAVVIIIAMGINIFNLFKQRNFGEMIFSHNGISGLVFYVSLLVFVLSMLGIIHVPGTVPGILIAVTLILMYLSEPLEKLVNGEKNWFPEDKIFFVQSLFEMVEVLLSYFSNTISFLRIGALAIAHVGMMKVVEVLAAGGGAKTVIVYIIGNIFVMALEGMIVCIQVLRLEYYEMFSRYYHGGGKPFVSIKDKNN